MTDNASIPQELNATSAAKQPQQPFIVLPFDEEISFQSAENLLDWVNKDKEMFQSFREDNFPAGIDLLRERGNKGNLTYIEALISDYKLWYNSLVDLSEEVNSLARLSTTARSIEELDDKKKLLIEKWIESTNKGLVPMQSPIGYCAMGMGSGSSSGSESPPEQSTQGGVWLYAMIDFRKQQAKQQKGATEFSENVEKSIGQLRTLNGNIQLAQEDLEAFKKNVLKSAALKSPANALGRLEKSHRCLSILYFGIAALIIIAWITFIVRWYYPDIVEPVLNKLPDAPLEAGPMILISLVFTGIVLTSVIIFLRLAVSLVNFSIAAGERKAMATAYRALLVQNAITDAQQMVFLQSIVGGKPTGFVQTSDIRLPADEICKIIRAVRDVGTTGITPSGA